MTFSVKATPYFIAQISQLSSHAKRMVAGKIALISENPYGFKRINSKQYSKVFRVRLKLDGKETRLIYVVLEPEVVLACLLERKNDYRDLEAALEKSLQK